MNKYKQKGNRTFSALSGNTNQKGTNPKDGEQLCLPPNEDSKRTKDPHTWKHWQGTMGIVRQKNSGGTGNNYTDQFDGKGENPTTTPTNSPKPQKGRERKGEKRTNINYTIAINMCTTTQCQAMYTTTHCNHHCSPSWCTYTNSTWKDIRSAQNNSMEGYILPPDSPPQHSTQAHNKEGKQIQPTTPTPRKPKPNKAQIKPQTPTLPGDTV